MAALTKEEITPGLNAFLDPAVLRACDGVQCNARDARFADRPGFFLVVEIDLAAGECLCTPLFSRDGPSRVPLDRALKTGPGNGWKARKSYFDRFQFYIIPVACMIRASSGEMSRVGRRQRYASATPQALADVALHKDSSDVGYRPFSN